MILFIFRHSLAIKNIISFFLYSFLGDHQLPDETMKTGGNSSRLLSTGDTFQDLK